MKESQAAHWFSKIQAVVVGLVGVYLVLLPIQCAYLTGVKHMRMFFPIIGYPISLVLGLLCIQTPYLVFRNDGLRARVQMWLCTAVAAPIIALLIASIFL